MDVVETLDFSIFKNVRIVGIDINTLTNDEMEVLYTQSRYCQGMVDATIDYTSVLDANAYGAKGVYRMRGTHKFKKVGDKWLSTNK